MVRVRVRVGVGVRVRVRVGVRVGNAAPPLTSRREGRPGRSPGQGWG